MLMVLAVLAPMAGGTALLISRCRQRRTRELAVMGMTLLTALLALLAVFSVPMSWSCWCGSQRGSLWPSGWMAWGAFLP